MVDVYSTQHPDRRRSRSRIRSGSSCSQGCVAQSGSELPKKQTWIHSPVTLSAKQEPRHHFAAFVRKAGLSVSPLHPTNHQLLRFELSPSSSTSTTAMA